MKVSSFLMKVRQFSLNAPVFEFVSGCLNASN